MAWRTWREQRAEHHHHHEDETRLVPTVERELVLGIFEHGVPPCWRISSPAGRRLPDAERIFLETLRPDGGEEVHALVFEEHDHAHMNLGDEDDAHAADIRNRFAGRPVTMWQIIVFGLTGGLIPCPARSSCC